MTDTTKSRPGAGTPGGRRRRSASSDSNRQSQHSQSGDKCNAPLGAIPATIKDNGLICVAGKHLCSVRSDALRRTFNPRRELLRGGLAFRLDVLALAVDAGAARIVASERGNGHHWIITMDAFWDHGWLYKNARYGDQWCCDLKHWHLIDNTPKKGGDPEAPEQMGLFEQAMRH